MGVPAFYRWLSEKYPKIVQDVLEERVHAAPGTGEPLPFDASRRPNPSGLECDNLYIDMNGIIHPCSHPEVGPQPTTEQEMFENVCRYTDRLVRVIRPRKLLYLAIDGVAPRAKMNQQRARRFRAAQEARELQETEEHVRHELEKMGHHVPPVKSAWDSNVITPGTPFMLQLAEYLRFYIRKRISEDKLWKNVIVLFSDASVPGEGEHKIMSHIRLQRSQPGYDPNTVHVLHGLDADLIMLALATHEAHFYISRELVTFGRRSEEEMDRRQLESGFRDKQRALDEAAGEEGMALEENKHKPLQRISIPILREYLAAEFAVCLAPGRLPFPPSLERLIDDIVFMCFFVGNDFLPHLPSLDIRDGALDYLFNVYKRILPSLGDYITKSGGAVNLTHVDVILAEVGAIEDYVFAMKHQNERREEERRRDQRERKKRGNKEDAPPVVAPPPTPRARVGKAARILEKQEQQQVALSRGHKAKEDARHSKKAKYMMENDNMKAAEELKASLGLVKTEDSVAMDDNVVEMQGQESSLDKNQAEDSVKMEDRAEASVLEEGEASSDVEIKLDPIGVVGDAEEEFETGEGDEDEEEEEDLFKVEVEDKIDPEAAKAFKEKVKAAQQKKLDDYSKSVEDNVRLHEAGWKDRYYTDKCKADDVSKHGGREHLFRSYVVGLCWVMKYYYDGCPSWKWYYPFHYAPFASDLKNIERFGKDVKALELSTPFNPVEQLMAVLPPDSSHAIPKASRWLMMDAESPIIDFYPNDVPVDPNGKAMPWLWVVLLPFIEEDRLLSALSPTMSKWTTEELLCNARGLDEGYLYAHKKHPISKKLETVLANGQTAKASKTRIADSAMYGCSVVGAVRPPLSNECHSLTDAVVLAPPPTANKIGRSDRTSIFADSIDPNDALCVAFTEPLKLSHKSILLPGARIAAPCLNDEDKRIRRPRLNRGGGTIANMGMASNGQSYQSGYGSMNINSYERQLAERTGRGNQMYQAGTREWGTLEPAPKRVRHGGPPPPPPPPPPHLTNPFVNQGRLNQPQGQPQWQGHQGPSYQQPRGPGPQDRGQPYRPDQGRGGFQQQYHAPPPQPYGYAGAPHQGSNQQQWGASGYQQPPQQGYAAANHFGGALPYPSQNQGAQRGGHSYQANRQTGGNSGQSFNFRSHGQGPANNRPGPPQQQHPPAQRARADVMNSLKAQLANTLRQNRRQG